MSAVEARLRKRGVRWWFGNLTPGLDAERLRRFYSRYGFDIGPSCQRLPPLLGRVWVMPGDAAGRILLLAQALTAHRLPAEGVDGGRERPVPPVGDPSGGAERGAGQKEPVFEAIVGPVRLGVLIEQGRERGPSGSGDCLDCFEGLGVDYDERRGVRLDQQPSFADHAVEAADGQRIGGEAVRDAPPPARTAGASVGPGRR